MTVRARGLLLLSAAALSITLPACTGSRSEPERVSAPALALAAALEPAEGRVGENHIWLTVNDDEGRPLAEADPKVKVHMVAMGAMPAMGGPASITRAGPGEYRADFELEMGGTWIVEIDVRDARDRPRRIEGSLTVGSPGLRLRLEGRATADAQAPPERHPGEFSFEPARLQKIGVRTTPVVRAELAATIRTSGRVVYDETRLVDVSPRVRGWIEELRADAVGMRVERGDVLFTLYSPELYAAQQELLQAQRSTGALAESLLRAARKRLRLWDVSPADLDRIAQRGEPLDALPVRAPASGFVIEKNVVAGSAVMPGQRLLRIAPLDRVWIEIDLYEADLTQVEPGQTAHVTLSHLPGRRYEGQVTFLYPYLRGETRTASARVELANPDLALRADMFADVELTGDAREVLVIPRSAVLHAGDRDFVFLALGAGRFRPQAVELGLRQDERVEVLAGLEAGQQVVSSGTFLIASESRLRSALEQW